MIEENRDSIIVRGIDVDSAAFGRFKRAFSIYDKVYHSYSFHAYTLIDGNAYIPATVTAAMVQTYFPLESIVKNYAGTAKAKPVSYNMVHQPISQIQTEALDFLVGMIRDPDTRSRMLNLATGTGKTYVSIAALSQFGVRGLIIVDSLDLANQWKREFLFHTDLKEEEIMILSGAETIDAAKKDATIKVFIAIHKTLGMLISENPDSINDLMRKLGIGVRIFDECHVNFKSICDINELSNVAYTIYLTATPNRSDFREDRLYQKVFGKVPYYNGHKDQIEKYHKVVLWEFNSHPTAKMKTSIRSKYGFSLNNWAKFMCEPEQYRYYYDSLKLIIDKLRLFDNKKKVAIMLPTIKMIEKTKIDLEKDYSADIGLFIGTIPKDKRLAELKKNVFLTDQKIFGKGIDVPDLDCIVNFAQINSTVMLEQIIGRLRNNSGHDHVIVDVTDIGFMECRNQKRTRKKFYEMNAKSVITITDTAV